MEFRTSGAVCLVFLCAAYAYYTFWALVTVRRGGGAGGLEGSGSATHRSIPRPAAHAQPFVEPDQPVLRLFPPTYYALAAPVLAGVCLWSTTLIALGCLLAGPELRK